MEPARILIPKLVESSDGELLESAGKDALDKIDEFYDCTVWEFIPEPWLIHVQVCIEGRAPLERWCYILGVGEANRRGLAIYDNIHDHEAAVSNREPPVISTTLMFIGGEKKNSHLVRTDGDNVNNPCIDDLTFILTGIIPLAEFICHHARKCLIDGLSNVETLAQGSVPSDDFPGTQHVVANGIPGGDAVTVKIAMSCAETLAAMNMTAAMNKTRPVRVERKCFVCSKTEAESILKVLNRCARCKSYNEMYCSKECQKLDWPRHKKTCMLQSERRRFTEPYGASIIPINGNRELSMNIARKELQVRNELRAARASGL